ncbi:ATP-binding cassette domain-containing protein, partial [Streptomyces niveus]|uniref:ATP-binding cassette domain-containing protein n=1 Tax=Streptomyces niveus TaxID=193462 RepID=UPI00368C1575
PMPEERVRAAARAASADAFVRLLPHGYATPPQAAPLSGGELQRLGLARAFARAGRLLVLDDATSSLDTVTERQVEAALARDVRHGTRLIVAHRLSSAARCDLVVWLEEGRVRATGAHEELWRSGEYRALFAPPEPASAAVPAATSKTEPYPRRAPVAARAVPLPRKHATEPAPAGDSAERADR